MTDALRLGRYSYIFPPLDGQWILFNALTGGLYLLDPGRRQFLEELKSRSRAGNIDDAFLDFLVREKICFTGPGEEERILRERWQGAQQPGGALNVTVMLTEACNLACTYCYQDKNPRRLGQAGRRRLAAYLQRHGSSHRSVHVHWFGGEPLLEYPALLDLASTLARDLTDRGIEFSHSITTNGTRISPEVARGLKNAGITHVQITLDGDERTHDRLRIAPSGRGSFRDSLNGALACRDAGLFVYVRVNLNRCTAPRVPFLLDLLRSEGLGPGACSVYFPETIDHEESGAGEGSVYFGSAAEYAHELMTCFEHLVQSDFPLPPLQPRSYFCPFDVSTSVLFGTDSGLHFCTTGTGWKTATVDDDGTVHRLARIAPRPILDRPGCRDCHVLPLCMGGCAYLEATGRPRCAPERFILQPLVRLHARQLLERKEVAL